MFSFASHKILVFLNFCLFLSCLLYICEGHSFLVNPSPMSKWCKACQTCKYVANSKLATMRAAEVWKRGQVVNVKWARNNHNGGFVRLSLVPYHLLYDPAAHEKFAFYYGCWEQGSYRCGKTKKCGSDKKGLGFHRRVSIPNVAPDGWYVLAFMWFGGVEYKRSKGKFPDFTSCSLVRIAGGGFPSRRYKAFFDAGDLGKYERSGKCLTSSPNPGQCRYGCPNISAFYSIPGLFKRNGGKSTFITFKDFRYS